MKKEGRHPIACDANLPTGLFHTQWEDPEINQIQTQNRAEREYWPKEPRRNAPHERFTLHMAAQRSLNSPMNLPTCIPFFPPNKHVLFPTFHFFVEIHFLQSRAARALTLTLGHHGLVTKIQRPPCHSPTSVLLGTKFLLQAAAGRGHLGSGERAAGGTRSEGEAVALSRPTEDPAEAEQRRRQG